MSIVLYIIEFLFCSALFMALYKLLIEGRVGYRLARIYLVWSMVLAAVIPTLELPLYPAETIYYQIPIVESFEADAFDFVEETAYIGETERLSEKVASVDWARVISTILWAIYAVVVMMNLAVVAWRLWQIKRLRDGAELTVYETYVLAVSDHITSPFAFWRTIFMNRLYEGREREQVILHELSHVRHNHTVERMTLELLRCIFWFNPFVWYAGSSLEQVQEWQADGDVIREGYDVTEYRLLIFQQIFGCDIDITSGLYNKVTKKRFLMMTNFKRGRFSFIRVCAVIPILVGMVFAFGSVRAESEINVVESEQADNVAQTAAKNKKRIILNKGTYTVGDFHSVSPASEVFPEFTISVLNDGELEIRNRGEWQLVASGKYSYVLTKDDFTLTQGKKKYSFKSTLSGPLFRSTLKIKTPTDTEISSVTLLGPLETQDSTVKLEIKNGTIYFNGKETTIEELNDVYYINFSAPTLNESGQVTEKPTIGDIVELFTGKSVSDQDATLHIAADGKISLNGKTVALADLESALRENKPAMVVISADKGVNMGQLADVRQILRNANVLRVKYINGNNNQSSPIVLPPAPQNLPYGIKPLDEITDAKIPAHNICRVLVNKNGKILLMQAKGFGDKSVASRTDIPQDDMSMLTGIIKEKFIGDDTQKGWADSKLVSYTLSDGRKVEYPLSEGIVSIECDAQAPYDVCVAVREAVAKAFYDIRSQLVSSWFGANKSIDNLSEADRSVVVRAVPMKIYESEPRGEEYTPSPKIQVSRGKLYVNDKEMTLDEMRRQYPEYERVGRFNLSSIDNWKSALILTSPDTPKIYVRKSGIGINEDEGNLTIQQLSKAGLDAEVAVYLCDKESVANESIDAIVEALVANKRVKTFCFHVMVTDERVGVCNYLVEKQADGSVRKVGFKPNDVVASQTSKRISASISSCLTDISSFEEIEDGKKVIVKVEDGKIYENDVLTSLEALEKKYPKSMQLTREEGGLEYRKLFKSELIATSSNINQIYMNGNKLTYKRTSSGGKASNYNIVCSLQQIATESLSSEVSVYVESATAQEIEAVIKSLEANKSVKCFCIVPRSTSKAILVEKQADGSIKRFAPSPKESKADSPAASDKESDYRIPYGMYSPSGYDTRWEWTKLSQEKMEEVFEGVPAISVISSDELEVYLRREVDFIKAGKYKYRVVGDELLLSNESGESYKFPLTLTIKEGLVEMILGIKAKVAGVKLKEVTMLSELKK